MTKGGCGGIPEKKKMGAMEGLEWEMRPGGMLVQKRTDSSSSSSFYPRNPRSSPPNIRVWVRYGSSSHHEILINSHARFEELKKMLSGATGVHPQDQKLVFNDRERDSNSYLDTSGVKDGSKLDLLLLVKDTDTSSLSQEKKPSLELSPRSCCSTRRRRTATVETEKSWNPAVTLVTIQIDKLAAQVADLESVICRDGKVAEKELLTLIEFFMSLLIQLDAIIAADDGDVKSQRKTQVVRVQKYIETLDRLKAQNAILRNTKRIQGGGLLTTYNNNHPHHPQNQPVQIQQQQQRRRNFTGLVVGTAKWENY